MKSIRLQKILLHCALSLPLILLSYRLGTNNLGVNPIESISHISGEWSLRLLFLTLLISPLQKILKTSNFMRFRRMTGLWCFAYVAIHFGVFIVFEVELRWVTIVYEIQQRPYLLVGFTGFVVLLVLTLTSTNNIQRRMKRNWLRLHKGIYVALVLALVHFWMLTKSDYTEPLVYTLAGATLMILRIKRVSNVMRKFNV